jgi:glycosyltransferase involved in cell wall biosynthesis
MKPAISVIMPFFNCEKYIARALESVLNQTFIDFELILINDASSDSSDDIIKKYLTDKRIIYIKNLTNKKIVANLNMGLKLAHADIVARMDGDDICYPDRFFKQYDYLVAHPNISIVGSFVHIIDENGVVVDKRTKLLHPEDIKRELIVYDPFTHPAVMFRKKAVTDVGGYRNNFSAEDMDLWFRLIYSGHNGANVPEYLLAYRHHANNVVAQKNRAVSFNDFHLRRETIRTFGLRLRFRQFIMLYGQLFAGVFLTGRGRQRVERWAKFIFYGKK